MSLPPRPKTEAEWVAALLQYGGERLVLPVWFRKLSKEAQEEGWDLHDEDCVPLREAFRRWKIAKKAHETRKRKQLALPI